MDPSKNLSPKRVLALVEGLPLESRVVSSLRDVEDATGWGTSTYLLAQLIDAVRENTFVNMQVRTRKRITPFEPFQVPGAESAKKSEPNSFVRAAQEALAKQGGGVYG